MTIHHGIVKKAAAKGVILTHDDDQIVAHLTEANLRVALDCDEEGDANETANDALAAVIEMRDYMAEHADISLDHQDGDFVAYKRTKAGKRAAEIARDPELADLFETLAEGNDEDDAEGAEDGDEDEATGSVVPEKYKAEYAARGDATTCGDWLALTLNAFCKITDAESGKEVTDIERLQTIANANDVSPALYGKLGMESNGWQGRYRMTVRNMLTPRVAAKGFLFIPDGVDSEGEREVTAPDEWRATRMPKAKAKDAKAAVSKDEGAGKQSKAARAKAQGEAGLATAKAALQSVKAKAQARKTATPA